MTTKKKTEAPKIELKKRIPKEKPNLFQNLTPFPKPNSHPLSDLMRLPLQEADKESLVNQTGSEQLTKKDSLVNQNENKKLTETIISVNQEPKDLLTKDESLVNKLTKDEAGLTKKIKNSEDLVNKLTKSQILVNQNSEKTGNWKDFEKTRSKNLSVVEGFRTSTEFKQKVKEFCAKFDIDKQDFYRIAGEFYMDHLVNQTGGDWVNKLTLDDRRMRLLWKTKAALINLYLRYNFVLNPNSKWTANDDDAACKFNEWDFRLIELGIIQTQANKRFSGKIASFGYYANEIQNFIDLNLPPESIDVMLDINRKRWSQATGRELDLKFLDEEN